MARADYDYLDEERKKLWHKVNTVETEVHRRIDRLDEELNKKATDYTDEARQASRKASEFRNKSEESKNTVFKYLEDANSKLNEINLIFSGIETLNSNIIEYESESASNSVLIKGIHENIEERKIAIENQISQIEKIFEDHDSLVEKVEKLQSTLTSSNDTSAKIETLYKSLLGRKNEIDRLYYDIFGYTETNGETETAVDGLRDKLEKSYDELSQDIQEAKTSIVDIKTQANNDYDSFQKIKQTNAEEHVRNWEFKYLGLEAKIEALLPNALTAGLSSAYSQKKDSEIKEYAKFNKTFNISIVLLVLVSLIPFSISIISLNQNKPLEKVLLDMPRLVLSILPLYIPILWVAYSSNRKMNLSKRLSEEYSHKEVLSKTFEGLSTQINNITDEKVSDDLRNKLLYNILEVSSENPGKLISDYNKSDHPLMDALDKSVKLATAFERLEKIPGFSRLANSIDKKSKAILKEETEKANKGISILEQDENETE